jgi:cold shock CspA family protein
MQSGTVINFRTDSSEGYVRSDEPGPDIKFQGRDVPAGTRKLRPGDRVRFEAIESQPGRWRITALNLLGA